MKSSFFICEGGFRNFFVAGGPLGAIHLGVAGHAGEASVRSVPPDVKRVQKGVEAAHHRLDEVGIIVRSTAGGCHLLPN